VRLARDLETAFGASAAFSEERNPNNFRIIKGTGKNESEPLAIAAKGFYGQAHAVG
jgi:hypothetical protein